MATRAGTGSWPTDQKALQSAQTLRKTPSGIEASGVLARPGVRRRAAGQVGRRIDLDSTLGA
jgi:hypothetical protein